MNLLLADYILRISEAMGCEPEVAYRGAICRWKNIFGDEVEMLPDAQYFCMIIVTSGTIRPWRGNDVWSTYEHLGESAPHVVVFCDANLDLSTRKLSPLRIIQEMTNRRLH